MQSEIQSVATIRTIDSVLKSPDKQKYTDTDSDKKASIERDERESKTVHKAYSEKKIEQMVEEASGVMLGVNAQLTFRIHEDTGRQLVQLIEKETQEVIREIPPEKMLDVLAGIWEWAGLIVDRKE